MNVLEVNFEKKLKNFPLHIQFQAEGGCIGILGASGCGKSMTFKAIAGIETPDSGKICLGKRELFHRGHKVNLPPRKRSVGYLFQSYALFPNMTVFQNIEAGIQGKKAAKRERAMEMMEKFHLSELASGYPARLSGGQQQRVALARTLAQNPQIILADEPVASLDPVTAKQVMEDFQRINKEMNITILLNIHHVELALTYASRVVGIRAGQIVYDGPVSDVNEEILNNIYEGKLEQEVAG